MAEHAARAGTARNFHWMIWAAIALFLTLRFAHWNIVWVEEAYGAAAGAEILRGKWLYRDIWFDKPPLYAIFYTLGGRAGLPLRLAGALCVLAAAGSAFCVARRLWTPVEGHIAAFLISFFLTFGIPSAVMAPAPDLLMIAPHLAAVCLALAGMPLASGAVAGIALMVNSKGIFVLAACMLFSGSIRGALYALAGFASVQLGFLLLLHEGQSLDAYILQVWQWGWLYSKDTFMDQPVREGISRTFNWAGFHSAAILAACWGFYRERAPRLALWAAIAVLAVIAGWRFFPRYYFHLLPVVCVIAARGFNMMPSRMRAACALLLLIPFIRFGPRYATLAADLIQSRPHEWRDLRLTEDSRQAAKLLAGMARPDDTLLVWGYRPEIFVYSGMSAGTRFIDSQPLTGVLADRHLNMSTATAPAIAELSRKELLKSSPSFIVDGLGSLNPALAITNYEDLKQWLARYHVAGRTEASIIYRLPPGPGGLPLVEKR